MRGSPISCSRRSRNCRGSFWNSSRCPGCSGGAGDSHWIRGPSVPQCTLSTIGASLAVPHDQTAVLLLARSGRGPFAQMQPLSHVIPGDFRGPRAGLPSRMCLPQGRHGSHKGAMDPDAVPSRSSPRARGQSWKLLMFEGRRPAMRDPFVVSFPVLVSMDSRNFRSSSPSLQEGVADAGVLSALRISITIAAVQVKLLPPQGSPVTGS